MSSGLLNTSIFNTFPYNAGVSGGTPATITAADIIYTAYRIAGIMTDPGRGNSSGQLTDGFNTLNTMLDAWKIDRGMIYADVRTEFATDTRNPAIYTIGLDGSPDFVLDRPPRLERAGFIYTNVTPNVEVPAKILTPQEWAAISPKNLTSTIWSMIYYQPFVLNGNVTLWPIPTSNWKVAFYTWQSVPLFVSITDPVIVPPGYLEPMEYNLAERLSHRFPKKANMTPEARALARTSLALIKNLNAPQLKMQVESAIRGGKGRYNILSNSYIGTPNP